MVNIVDQGTPQGMVELAGELCMQGNFPAAARELRRAESLIPKNVYLRAMSVEIDLARQDYSAARRGWVRLVTLEDPEKWDHIEASLEVIHDMLEYPRPEIPEDITRQTSRSVIGLMGRMLDVLEATR